MEAIIKKIELFLNVEKVDPTMVILSKDDYREFKEGLLVKSLRYTSDISDEVSEALLPSITVWGVTMVVIQADVKESFVAYAK